MNRKTLLIFDMDGTVLDTLEDLTDSVNYALASNGMPQRTLEEVRAFVGNGIHKLAERAVQEGTDEAKTERVYACLMEHYQAHCLDKTKPYDGIESLMKEAKARGAKTAIVSNKANAAVQKLGKLFFDGLSDFCIGEYPGVEKKPAPDMVYEALSQLKTDAKDAVYIGDSDVDLKTAQNAGLDCITVTWGFRDRAFLERNGAKAFADKPSDILNICLY